MMLLKCCTQYVSTFGKLSSGHRRLKKFSFHSNLKEGQYQRMFKLCSFHILVRLCSKSSKLGFNSTWIENFQYKLCLEKAEEPEIKLPTLVNHGKSNRVPGKHIYFCFIDCAKAFDCVDHNKLWTIFKEMGLPDHLTYLLRNLYAG